MSPFHRSGNGSLWRVSVLLSQGSNLPDSVVGLETPGSNASRDTDKLYNPQRGRGDTRGRVAPGSVLTTSLQLRNTLGGKCPLAGDRRWGCVWKTRVHSQTQTVMFPVGPCFLSAEAPQPGARLYFLWLESSVWEKSTIRRQTRETVRQGKTNKTDTGQKCKGIQNESSDFHSVPEACQTQGFVSEERKKTDLY